jgi:hypothetical protein
MAKYATLYPAITGLVLLVVSTELGADSKWYQYVVAAITAAAVWFVPNKQPDA